ncbi:helix-turn-helix domain-containing protein [Pseudooceanicola algae]|uniref:Cytoskeleton protein RodZ-like C-terminal domain-containing protein n=1 Tax=Pseudooceanicola algae TaxID=1537215 RepID=A0A418SDL4_9RHOB|nr:RodZ domain-containing protein [Pseudooceanicola algae]QPM89410.1 hypothetical protein PSAL_006290 [Pseudooceanicola algae]
MRGERATLGKSLLDVQRELRIKANYIAAIENCDPQAFDTPGFIAGYVRSYSRYLGMDPDETFRKFCAESGFVSANGKSFDSAPRKPERVRSDKGRKDSARRDRAPQMSRAETAVGKATAADETPRVGAFKARDPFTAPATPFIPQGDSMLSRIEPAAIGSALVLLAVIGGLGYGGYAVLNEIQRVQFAPVENRPDVLADLDPLAGATRRIEDPVAGQQSAGLYVAQGEGLDRLYRPKALDVPVVVSRDAPISTLNPSQIGTFAAGPEVTAPALPADSTAGEMVAGLHPAEASPVPQVVTDVPPGVSLLAVRPAWVRVQSVDGSIIFEKIMDAGETFQLPNSEDAPILRAGMAGSVYFSVDGELYGPAGKGTSAVRNIGLAPQDLKESFVLADLTLDPEAARVVAVAEANIDGLPITD